jgi:hypothetical protein
MKKLLMVIFAIIFFAYGISYGGWVKNLLRDDNKDVIGTWRCVSGCRSGLQKHIVFHKNESFERGNVKGYYSYSSDNELSMGSIVIKIPFETAADFFMDQDKMGFGLVWQNGTEEGFVKTK